MINYQFLEDNLTKGIAGPVKVKHFLKKTQNEKFGWNEPQTAHILVHGCLSWRVEPPEPLAFLSGWNNAKRFDLIRSYTKLTRCSPQAFEIVAPDRNGSIAASNRRLYIETDTREESEFWEYHINLFIEPWEDIMKRRGKRPDKPKPAYDVATFVTNGATGSTVSEPLVEESTRATKTSETIREKVIDPVLDFVADSNPAASGVTDALKFSPIVGVGFAVVGYGLSVASRYAKDNRDLPHAQELALDLFKQCLRNLVSLERVPDQTNVDTTRRKKVVEALADIETAIYILNEQQRKKGRVKLLDAFFKDQGEATKMLEITLDSCRSKLADMETHYALMGVDLIRTMLTESMKMIDTEDDSPGEHMSVLVSEVQNIKVDLSALVSAVVNGGQHTSALLENNLLHSVRSCRHIEDFERIYDSDQFQFSLRRLEVAQGNQEKESWAKKWAYDMREGKDTAVELNKDRKVCLELLYIMCNQWKDEGLVTEEDIKEKFKERRIRRILGLCLVMDRAQALYKMQEPGSHQYGMHWYAKEHKTSPEWKEYVKDFYKLNAPTLNRRILLLTKLINVEDPDLAEQNKFLKSWIKPMAVGEKSSE